MINKITNWWMSLLNGGSEGEVAVDTKLPQDYCSQDNTIPPDVSEPVVSFYNAVISDPKRFYFKWEAGFHISIFYCYDRQLKKGYALEEKGWASRFYPLSSLKTCGVEVKLENISFLTSLELRFIYDKLVQPAKDRQRKYTEIKTARKLRNQRSKLTKLYKGDQQ